MSLGSVVQAASESRQMTAGAPTHDYSAQEQGIASGSAAEGYDRKIAELSHQLQKCKERLNNLNRDEPRLDWPRKKRVADVNDPLTLEEAIADAKQAVEDKMANLRADLATLEGHKQQALSVATILQNTNLLPAMKNDTDRLPEIHQKMNAIHAVICQGDSDIDPELGTEEGKNAIRISKVILTNKFQAYNKRPGLTCGEVDAELEREVAEETAKRENIQQMKEDYMLANGRRGALAEELKKLKTQHSLSKLLGNDEKTKRLAQQLKDIGNELQTATQEAADAKEAWEAARPKKQPKVLDSNLKLLEADAAVAKANLVKAVDTLRLAKGRSDAAKATYSSAAHQAKIARGVDATPALEAKRVAAEQKIECEQEFLIARLAKFEAEEKHKAAATAVTEYKKTGKLPSHLQSEKESEEESVEEAPAFLSAGAEAATASSAASSPSGVACAETQAPKKRKADQVDKSAPPGANRSEAKRLAKAQQDPKQKKL